MRGVPGNRPAHGAHLQVGPLDGHCIHLHHPHRGHPGGGELVLDHAPGGFDGRGGQGRGEGPRRLVVSRRAVCVCPLRRYPVPGGAVHEGGVLKI